MDPKSAQLDPKLKEIYDRVMGTSTTPNPAPLKPQQPVSNNPVPPPSSSDPTSQTPSLPPQTPNQTPMSETPASPNEPTATPEPAPAAQPNLNQSIPPTEPEAAEDSSQTSFHSAMPAATLGAREKKKVSPVILILGIVVFLIVYALVWIKIFGFKLPFLS